MSRYLYTIILLGVLAGCAKEAMVSPELYINNQLAPFFDLFVEEAAQRGVMIDFTETPVEGHLALIPGKSIGGQCTHDGNNPSEVIIDEAYWAFASEIDREFIVMHELGHCYLKRAHDDTRNPNGTCTSIMHSGTGACTNVYNASTRGEYLDELFK